MKTLLVGLLLVALFFASTPVQANSDDDVAFFALLLNHMQQKQAEKKQIRALADVLVALSRPSSSYRPSYRPSTRPSTRPSSRPTVSSKRPTYSSKRPTTTTKKPTTSVKKPTTTTKKPSSPTKKPTATTKKPTTTTKKPTTTTPKKPTTTTKKPTTTTKKPSTTTPKKPTTPTKKPTETKKPVEKKPVEKKPVEKKPVETKPVTKPTTPSAPVKNLAAAQADKIIGYEGRFDKKGNLMVYKLPSGDGGGKYEVAGINDRYHPRAAAELKGMIERGEYQKARDAAAKYLAQYTDPSASKSKIPAISFYLRDASFNRGPGGANTILKHALGLGKGASSQETNAALAKAEKSNPQELLSKLRQSREWYERNYAHRNESSKFWKGLVNRWNNAEKDARSFGFTPQE